MQNLQQIIITIKNKVSDISKYNNNDNNNNINSNIII